MDIEECRKGNWVKIYGAKPSQIDEVYISDNTVSIKGETGRFHISVLEPIAFTKHIERQIKDKEQLSTIENYFKEYPDAPIHQLQNDYYDIFREELPITPL